MNLLNDLTRRTRQHHAIEHATIHMLSSRFPRLRFSGVSDPVGFTLLASVDEADVRRAVGDALLRLQAGESDLAIHPKCGTNLAVSAILATVAALIGSWRHNRLDRFATSLLLVLAALTVAQPLGFRVQAYTTQADVSDRWLAEVLLFDVAGYRVYRVHFD
jgi:hypothetical protein